MSRDAVIVVGAGGFLGRACASVLSRAGKRVCCVDIVDGSVGGTESWTVADVAKDGIPERLLTQASTLFHFAWRNDPGRGNNDMTSDVRTNVAGAVRAFEAAARAGVKRIIYPSSGGTIYGRDPELPTPETAPIAPIGGYGAGKAAAEVYLHAIGSAYGIETSALRIANPYGPGQYPDRGQGFIATAIARTMRGESIEVFGTAALSRDYIYIDDLAESFLLACEAEKLPAVLNIGTSLDYTIEALLPMIFVAVGHVTDVLMMPARPVDVPRVRLDISLARKTLNWGPRTRLTEGLKRTAAWIESIRCS